MDKSPYLKEYRLADVIAAIQVLGTYKFYKLDFKGWSKRITGTEKSEQHWRTVFFEHPEFFRINHGEDKVSLIWRRSLRKCYDVDSGKILTHQEFLNKTDEDKKRISRPPLSNEDIHSLILTANNLYQKALEEKRERRWWISPLLTIIGVLIGLLPFVITTCDNSHIDESKNNHGDELNAVE